MSNSNKVLGFLLILVVGAAGLYFSGLMPPFFPDTAPVDPTPDNDADDDSDDTDPTTPNPTDDVAPVVGILDPDMNDELAGEVQIRAMVFDLSATTLEVLINNSVIGTAVPLQWDTTSVEDGRYNITVRATDTHNNVGQDSVFVTVANYVDPLAGLSVIQTVTNSSSTAESASGTAWADIPNWNATIYTTVGSYLNLTLNLTLIINTAYAYEIRFTVDGVGYPTAVYLQNNLTNPLIVSLLVGPVSPEQHEIRVQWKMNDANGEIYTNPTKQRYLTLDEWNIGVPLGLRQMFIRSTSTTINVVHNSFITEYEIQFTLLAGEKFYMEFEWRDLANSMTYFLINGENYGPGAIAIPKKMNLPQPYFEISSTSSYLFRLFGQIPLSAGQKTIQIYYYDHNNGNTGQLNYGSLKVWTYFEA